MNEILDVVMRVPGVSGTALCNQQGECVLSQLIPPFEPIEIGALSPIIDPGCMTISSAAIPTMIPAERAMRWT